jgi:hypothetical protein
MQALHFLDPTTERLVAFNFGHWLREGEVSNELYRELLKEVPESVLMFSSCIDIRYTPVLPAEAGVSERRAISAHGAIPPFGSPCSYWRRLFSPVRQQYTEPGVHREECG